MVICHHCAKPSLSSSLLLEFPFSELEIEFFMLFEVFHSTKDVFLRKSHWTAPVGICMLLLGDILMSLL